MKTPVLSSIGSYCPFLTKASFPRSIVSLPITHFYIRAVSFTSAGLPAVSPLIALTFYYLVAELPFFY
jgi:hypothetical protein